MVQTQEKRGNGEAVLEDQPPQKKQAVEEPSAAPPSGIERGTAHPSKEEESKNASTPISNGKPVVEEEEEEEIEVTNEVDFAMTALLEGHKRGVAYVAFSPDGNQLASCSADSGVKVWDPHKGQLVTDLNTKETAGDLGCHEAGISCIAWSPDSKLICTAADDKTLRVWDVSTGKCLSVLRGHTHFVMCCDFSCRGNMIVSGALDETVRIWEVKTGLCLKELPAHSDPVSSVKFSPDASIFVSSSFDGLCRLWDTETGKCLQTIFLSSNPPVSSVRFTPNGRFLLMTHLDHSIRLWNIEEAKWIKKYCGHKNEKFSLTSDILTQGEVPMVVSGSENHDIFLWNVNTQRVSCRLRGMPTQPGETEEIVAKKKEAHSDVVIAVACNPKFPMIASGALEPDKSVRVWTRKDK